jgi:hypothetical protein
MLPRTPLARIANEQVPFSQAASWAGLRGVSDRGTRDTCPKCGHEASFRGYLDHGFCHQCRTYFSTVTLLAVKWEMTNFDAARRALDQIGYVPLDYAGEWEHAQREPELDTPALARALRTWCAANLPGWESKQLDPGPAHVLARCLGLLPRVKTEQDCDEWLRRCTQVMGRLFGKAT